MRLPRRLRVVVMTKKNCDRVSGGGQNTVAEPVEARFSLSISSAGDWRPAYAG